jgi:hypothetical protein
MGGAIIIPNLVVDNRVEMLMKYEMADESVRPCRCGDEITLEIRVNVKAPWSDGVSLENSEVLEVRIDSVGGDVNRHCV